MTSEMRLTLAAVIGSWVMVGATIYSMWDQHQNAKESLSVQIAFELDKQWDSVEMHRARQKLAALLLDKQPVSDDKVLDFFEKVGLYANQKDVDEEKIYNAFSDWVENYWVASQTVIKEARAEKRGGDYYVEFEKLYKWVLAQQAKKTGKPAVPLTLEDIRDFLTDEKNLSD
jgi:hypothetical protein